MVLPVMQKHDKLIIPLKFDNIAELIVYSEAKSHNSLFHIAEYEAMEFGESPFQLLEGHSYEYEIKPPNYKLSEIPGIISLSKRDKSAGRITPNIYVGTLCLEVLDIETEEKKCDLEIEVQSIKTSYREDYRFMLEDITEKCTDLLMQYNSPVKQNFTTDFEKDNETIYQRFTFVQSILNSFEFKEALQKILTSPTTKWAEKTELTDLRKVRRINNNGIRQIINSPIRSELPPHHPLRSKNISSIPSKILSSRKIETVDTPENRFVKYVLEVFLKFCNDFESVIKNNSRIKKEAEVLINNLENSLNHHIFKNISRPNTLQLNSPVLQHKSGYREILRVWLMFDLAAKLVWKGGEDVYKGGKRDIATLYEYWLFFTLLNIIENEFEIEAKSIEKLIKPTKDGLGLQLIQGKQIAIEGTYDSGTRKLHIEFSFNRTFSGNKSYPDSGSWTKSMRPDYTLSFWPYGISSKEAEKQELIVHIHFDAKYKIENIFQSLNNEENLDEERFEELKGKYKNADLLKMHSYKDAIRRTGGAYILYPGDKAYEKRGFHELIPGLGAFPIRPSKNENGVYELKLFIQRIVSHFLNRASQRENLSFRVYDIHKNNESNTLNELIPESYGINRELVPDETFVLVGFYKNEEHYNWIEKKKLYNLRLDTRNGSIQLTKEILAAKYLLFHTHGENASNNMWKILGNGPRVFSKEKMIAEGYTTENSYLIFEIEKLGKVEFNNAYWDFKKLDIYSSKRGSAKPFVVTLTKLMKVKIK